MPIVLGSLTLALAPVANAPLADVFGALSSFLSLTPGTFTLATLGGVFLVSVVASRSRQWEDRVRELEALLKERDGTIAQREQELSLLNDVQEALVRQTEMQAIYDLVGDRIRDIFDSQVVVIRTFDRDAMTETLNYIVEKGERFYVKPAPADAFTRHLMELREPLLINEDMAGFVQRMDETPAARAGEFPRSALFVPLIARGEIRGNVSLQNVDREHAFTDSDVRLLSTLANSMSVALESARLFAETNRLLAEMEQRNAELAVINGVQEGLVAAFEMQAIYDLVGDRIRDIFDAQIVAIVTFDHETAREHFEYIIEKGARVYPPPRPFDEVRRQLIEKREPILVNEGLVELATRLGKAPPKPVPGTELPKSVLFVPLVVGDAVKGYVSLQNIDREHAFAESDVRLLTTLANGMSVALENARLFDETRQQAAELETVNRVSRALVAQLEFDALVQLVGEQVRETFRADIAYVALYDRETDMLRFPYEYGEHIPPRPFGSGLTEKVITTREPLLINRDLAAVRAKLQSERIGRDPASYLGVPILTGDTAIGVISVQSMEEENRFDADDLRLLGTIAANVGVAMQNAEAYRKLNAAVEHLKQAQEQLVQSEKMASLGALTAGIAHEIKNPLNFVNNFAALSAELVNEVEEELAARPDLPAAELMEVLGDLKTNASKIVEHGRRADGIVRSMLEHSRGTKGERRAVDLNALLEEYLNLAYHGMRAQTSDFNCTLERDYDDSVGEVEMVPQEIGRVLINLLNNAFYTVHQKRLSIDGPYEPTVRASTHRGAGRVEIRIRDNGTGIPPDVQQKIFEPFFTTKPTGSGTGLGLSLSYEIVTQGHRGEMQVDSREGEYTQFRIILPA